MALIVPHDTPFLDWLGNEIKVGDQVVYPVNEGYAYTLAEVVWISGDRLIAWNHTHKEPIPNKITVRPIKSTRNWEYGSRTVSLTRITNVMLSPTRVEVRDDEHGTH